jgi:hypothetical protein
MSVSRSHSSATHAPKGNAEANHHARFFRSAQSSAAAAQFYFTALDRFQFDAGSRRQPRASTAARLLQGHRCEPFQLFSNLYSPTPRRARILASWQIEGKQS